MVCTIFFVFDMGFGRRLSSTFCRQFWIVICVHSLKKNCFPVGE